MINKRCYKQWLNQFFLCQHWCKNNQQKRVWDIKISNISSISYVLTLLILHLRTGRSSKTRTLFKKLNLSAFWLKNRYILACLQILDGFSNATVTISLFTRGFVYKIRCKHSQDHPMKNIVRLLQGSQPLGILNFR